MSKRYSSLLTRVSHLSFPSDRLSLFLQDHTRKWCQGIAKNSVTEISPLSRDQTRNLCVSCIPSMLKEISLVVIKTGSTAVPFKLPTRMLRQSSARGSSVPVTSSSSVISVVPDFVSITAVLVDTVRIGVIPSPEFCLFTFRTG